MNSTGKVILSLFGIAIIGGGIYVAYTKFREWQTTGVGEVTAETKSNQIVVTKN